MLLALLLFILYPHGNKTKPVKRQDGSCPLHCSKHTTACEALHHLPISLLTPNTSLTSSSSSPLTHTHPSTGLLAGAQTCQEYSVLRAVEFAVPSAWPTMSAFSHTTPSLTSFKPSWLDILLFCFSFNVTVLHAFLYVALNPLGKIIMNAVTLLRQSRN